MNITNTKGPALTDELDDETERGGLGPKLMVAFVSQPEGTAEVIETGESYTYQLEFEVADFAV